MTCLIFDYYLSVFSVWQMKALSSLCFLESELWAAAKCGMWLDVRYIALHISLLLTFIFHPISSAWGTISTYYKSFNALHSSIKSVPYLYGKWYTRKSFSYHLHAWSNIIGAICRMGRRIILRDLLGQASLCCRSIEIPVILGSYMAPGLIWDLCTSSCWPPSLFLYGPRSIFFIMVCHRVFYSLCYGYLFYIYIILCYCVLLIFVIWSSCTFVILCFMISLVTCNQLAYPLTDYLFSCEFTKFEHFIIYFPLAIYPTCKLPYFCLIGIIWVF